MARLLPLLPLLLAGLAAAAWSAEPARFTKDDDGCTVTVRLGARFTVELAENPSTGYSWKVVSAGAPAVRQLGEPAFRQDGRLRGSAGTLAIPFEAAAEGRGAIALAYARPFEKDAKPAATFALTVVVEK
ncbi:MAG TPA: protease inhibitor I42 family protein [Thermoanaerobaculaceae bacterium]|nr:protease inhibitor I42 family protein [Thermoanaerobaculaceae bacterium]